MEDFAAAPMALSLSQQFEIERTTRVIEGTRDMESLRGLAKQLLQAWMAQKAATEWIWRQQMLPKATVPALAD